MSTKKIEGYVDQFSVQPHSLEPNENITFQDHKWLSGDVPATLVIHETERERVYTESEARAMLEEVRDKLEANCRWQSGIEVVSASAMRQAFLGPDVLSLD